MGSNHLDVIALGQVAVQALTVVGSVPRSVVPGGVEKAVSEQAFDELTFVRRSAFDTNGERKTVIIGESDDFRPFAVLVGPTARPPFLPP